MGLAAFALYLATAAPGLGPGHDSGELTTAAYCLGVAHPPGYPLYVRLGHLWARLWGGDYGWRLNLFSGFGTALAAAGLSWLVARATAHGPAALLAGLGFAMLGSVWRQAVVAEVFGLHFALLAGLAVLGWLVVERGHEPRWLWAFYACLGLCLAHHHTFVLALPGLLLLAWGHWRRVLLTRAWLMVPLIAFPFYLDMMWRARGEPALNWGGVVGWSELRDHFLRRAYGTFQLTSRVDPLEHGVAHGLGYLLFTWARQAPWPFMLLGVWGGLVGRRLQPRLWALGWAWLLLFGPFFALIGRQKLDAFHLDLLERFYASSYLGLALLAGLGMVALSRRWRPAWSWSLVVALLGWQGLANLEACRLDRRELTASYGRLVLASCPPRAVLMLHGDLPVGVVQYLQIVEGLRADVQTFCQGLLGSGWYRRRLPPEFRQVLGPPEREELALMGQAESLGRPVFLTQHRRLPGAWRPRAVCWQWSSRPFSDPAAEEASLRRLLQDCATVRPGLAGEARFWPLYLVSVRLASLRHLAGAVFQQRPQLALAALDTAIDLGAQQPVDFLNRGLLYQKLGRHRAALADFAECRQRDPKMRLAALAELYSRVYMLVEGPASRLGAFCSSP